MTARDFLGLSIRAEWKATVLRSTTALWLLVLEARMRDGRAEVTVPAFRYHTMVVFRLARRD
jgi:hypothetical protein